MSSHECPCRRLHEETTGQLPEASHASCPEEVSCCSPPLFPCPGSSNNLLGLHRFCLEKVPGTGTGVFKGLNL